MKCVCSHLIVWTSDVALYEHYFIPQGLKPAPKHRISESSRGSHTISAAASWARLHSSERWAEYWLNYAWRAGIFAWWLALIRLDNRLAPVQALLCNENGHVGASMWLCLLLRLLLCRCQVPSWSPLLFSLHLYYDQSSPPVEGSPQWMSSRKGCPWGFLTRLSSILYFPAHFVQFPCFSFLLRFPFWRDRFRLQLNNNFN